MKKVTIFTAVLLSLAGMAYGQWTYDSLSKPRTAMAYGVMGDSLILAGGYGTSGSLSDVEVYDPGAGQGYVTEGSLFIARGNVTGAVCGGKFFCAGGAVSFQTPLSIVDVFDAQTQQWSVEQLSQGRFMISAVSAGNKVFFAGGFVDWYLYGSDVVDIYDLQTQTWSVANLSLPRGGLAAAALGDLVIFAGGMIDQNTFSDRVDIYNMSTNTWITAALSVPRAMVEVAAVGNKILIAGGITAMGVASDVVDIYDITDNSWSTASLSTPRSLVKAATLNGKVYFAGGATFNFGWSNYSNIIDIYNEEDDSWSIDIMPVNCLDPAIAAIGDYLVIAGGENQNGVMDLVQVFYDPPEPNIIIHVPGDYPTIQAGINASMPGDTVLVAEGTYYGQINFMGKKPLTVASLFLMDGDTSHISNTIIDGSLLTNPDSASVVYFVSGEDTTSVLCGFTIQHGRGTFTPENFDDLQGGGIWISDAGAKIIHNRITHNTLDDRQAIHGNSVGGAGIGAKWADGDYWLVIGYNTIDSNTCISKYDYAWGGGISSSYNTRLFHNIISHNTCSGVMNAPGQGAGIGIGQDTAWTSPVRLIAVNNTITHNVSQAQNNLANGAGALLQDVSVFFSGNEVAENMVNSGSLTTGGVGGVLILLTETESVVRNNLFKANVSNSWSGGLHLEDIEILGNTVHVENNYFIDNVARTGGAFSTISVPCILLNNVFSGNHAQTSGGGIYLRDYEYQPIDHFSTIVNNSFSENSAQNGGAIFAYNAGHLTFNNIFWQDSASNGREIYKASMATFEIANSNINMDGIYGQVIDGGGNLNEDPLFIDTVLLTTEPFSPCIDAGVPIFVCSCGESNSAPLYDITGVPRPAGIGFDMGAYDLAYSGVGIRNFGPALALSVWPNPCTASATFTYALAQPALVLLRVYDNLGRLAATLVNGPQQSGEQTIEWNTKDLPAGVYYYRIMAGNQSGSGKMVKH